MKRVLGAEGYSLIDMTVGLVLLGIVLLSIYAFYRPTFTFSRTVGERLAAQQDIRLAIDRMARALHETTMAPGRLRAYSAQAGCTGAYEGCMGFVTARDAECTGPFHLIAGAPNWQATLYVWRDTTANELRLHCETSTTFPVATWPPPTLEPYTVIGTRVVAASFALEPSGSAATSVAMAVEEEIAGPSRAAARKAYVGVFGENLIEVIDTGTNQVIHAILIPTGPHGLAVTPDGRRIYASSDGASVVSVIDTAADRVTAEIDVGRSPHGLAVTPDGRLVLAAVFGASQVAWIDTAHNEVVARVPVGNPHNIAISPDGQTAYIAAQQQGAPALVVLDLARRAEVGRVPLDKTPRALSFSPDGKSLYFTLAGVDAVQVLDPARRRVVAQIPVGASPHHPLVTPTGAYGLVVSQGPGELAIFIPGTSQAIGTVTTGKLPHWIAVGPDGGTAYVTNEGSNTVAVVDLATQRVVAEIPVGNAPRTIVLQPGGAAGRSSLHRTLFNRTVFVPQNR